MGYEVGQKVAEGKTKIGCDIIDHPDLMYFRYKPDITKFDNPDLTEEFANKGVYSNTVNCNVFELLCQAGLPVAHVEWASPDSFVAKRCRMEPVEAVIRRGDFGSFLLRHPEARKPEGERPGWRPVLETEFFLKTGKGKCVTPEGLTLVQGLNVEDPFISNPYDPVWKLYHPKKPASDPDAYLEKTVRKVDALIKKDSIRAMDDILRNAFLVMEKAFGMLGYILIDMKLEFGIDTDGNICIADVIDPDSFRLVNLAFEQFSKEAFRAGAGMVEVEEKYLIVAKVSQGLHQPKKQVLILWRGSEKDPLPDLEVFDLPSMGVEVVQIILSGHKHPEDCLGRLMEIKRDYPEGTSVVPIVGLSNALGPILSARTTSSVFSVPVGAMELPQIVWSSLLMPSNVPHATVMSLSNAVLCGLNVLSANNPALYCYLRRAIEDRLAA